MESTANIGNQCGGALERYWKRLREKREGARRRSGTLHLAQAQSNRGPRGRKKDFPDAERLVKRLVARELTLSFVPDAEQASVADGDAEKVPVDAQPSAAAEPTGVFSGRGPH